MCASVFSFLIYFIFEVFFVKMIKMLKHYSKSYIFSNLKHLELTVFFFCSNYTF